jgi:TrpR-related protein YerC/YecD
MAADKNTKPLMQALLSLTSEKEALLFLQDLCTPQELEDLALRWKVVDALHHGHTYREIHARTGASLTTIGRIAKAINYGNGGYALIYQRLNPEK